MNILVRYRVPDSELQVPESMRFPLTTRRSRWLPAFCRDTERGIEYSLDFLPGGDLPDGHRRQPTGRP